MNSYFMLSITKCYLLLLRCVKMLNKYWDVSLYKYLYKTKTFQEYMWMLVGVKISMRLIYLLWNIWLNEINMKCNGIRIVVLIGIYYELEVGLLDINDVMFMMTCEYNMWLSRLALWPSTRRNVDFVDWLYGHRLWEMMIMLIGFMTINNVECVDYVDWIYDH